MSRNSDNRNYVVFLEPPTNKGIFERQLRQFREIGYRMWCIYPAIQVTRQLEVRRVTREQYDSSLFTDVIAIPAISYFGYPGPFAFLWLWFALLLRRSRLSPLTQRGAILRCRNLLFPVLARCIGTRSELVCDVRGVLHDEAALLGRPLMSVRFIFLLEKIALRYVSNLTAVTPSLSAYIRAIGYRGHLSLNPPVVKRMKPFDKDSAKPPVRDVVFLGTLSPWNNEAALEQFFDSFNTVEHILFLGNVTDLQKVKILELSGLSIPFCCGPIMFDVTSISSHGRPGFLSLVLAVPHQVCMEELIFKQCLNTIVLIT